MYQGTGGLKNFKVQSQVHKGLFIQCSSSITSTGVRANVLSSSLDVMTLFIKCQSPTVITING